MFCLYQTLMLFDFDTLTRFIRSVFLLCWESQIKCCSCLRNNIHKSFIDSNGHFHLKYDSVFESMYKTLGKMWMLSVSCRLVSIYCYNLQLFSCVLSLLIHNCCRRCLYILLRQMKLKINYWSNVLLSNSRIFITWEDDKLYPADRSSILLEHIQYGPFWIVFGVCDCGASLFQHLWTTKSTDTVSFAVLSFNKYKFFIFHQLMLHAK